MNNLIRGSGGKSGEESRSPIEAPDSLRSVAFARVLDLVSEGEIQGFANAEQPLTCIYFNETAVANIDNTLNFKNLQIEFRSGTQTQGYIKGFDSTENEIGVGVELKHDTPWTQQISNINIDAVRIRLSVPALSLVDTETGDTKGYSIQYAIDLNTNGGGFVQVFRSAFTGKSSSKYERTHRIELPPSPTGWQVRVRRITFNTDAGNIQDMTIVESFAEIVDVKLRYPMSAVVAVTIDAEQFNNIPSRAYRLKGRIIRVPSNYDPVTRLYSGIWNGTFKPAYSNNPAWVFYDMATNKRYGLGKRVPENLIDKWALYAIGVYCDELVPDGFGGTEPRFTCNIYLQTQADATRVMQDLATVFRGIQYVSGAALTAVGDMPQDAIYTYTRANVIDGRFTYAGSSQKVRHTTALVTWNDMNNFGRAKVEYVEDEEGIARYGVQQTEVVAMGCTSRGQARRLGRYILATERYETDTITFEVGLDGTIVAPGSIIAVSDPLRAGRRMAGRIAGGTASVLKVDQLPENVAFGDKLTIILPSGMPQMRIVTTVNALTREITVSAPFSDAPQVNSVWLVETLNVNAQTYRVISVAEKEQTKYVITALQHVPGKYDYVELDIPIDEPPISDSDAVLRAPTFVTLQNAVQYSHDTAHNVITASWENVPGATKYDIQWRKSDGAWTAPIRKSENTDDWEGAFAGSYIVRVAPVNARGIVGKHATSEQITVGDPVLPIVNLAINDGVVIVDCRFAQFRLLLDEDVTLVLFTNVAPQDTILIEVTMGGNGMHTMALGSSVVPIDGLPYVPTAAVGATDVLGLTTTNQGGTWRMALQKAFGGGTPLTATITPDPISASHVSAPSAPVTVTMAGGTGPYTAIWSRTDDTPGTTFLIANGNTLTPTLSMPAGDTYAYMAQTWAVLVTDTATGFVAQASVNVIFERTPADGGGETGVFQASINGDFYGSCHATGGNPCSPATTVTASPIGGTAPFTYQWARVDGAGGANFMADNLTYASVTFYMGNASSNLGRTQTWECTITDAENLVAKGLAEITLERTNDA